MVRLIFCISIVVIIWWGISKSISSYSYRELFQQKINNEEAEEIKEALDEWKYQYLYDTASYIFRVSAKQKDEILLKLGSEAKLPRSDNGYVNSQNSGVEKKLIVKRDLEKKIRKFIKNIDGVKAVQVALQISDDSAAVEQPSKASISLELKPNIQLNKKQINDIVNIVINYVPSCKPKNVMIVDAITGIVINDID